MQAKLYLKIKTSVLKNINPDYEKTFYETKIENFDYYC